MRTWTIMIVSMAAIGSLLIGVNDASAGGWGRYRVSTGCYGSSSGCYGVSAGCYGCYGGYGGYGCSGGRRVGFATRIHARHVARSCDGGCFGSCSGGCYSGCYSGGCYSSCYGGCYVRRSCCAPVVSCCGTTVVYDSAPVQHDTQDAPAVDPTPAADPAPALPAPVEGAQLSHGDALLAVAVPSGAEIYVNGYKTKAKGSQRRYMSSGLIPGRSYRYQVQAVVEREGKRRTIKKDVTLTAGSTAKLKFEFADDVQDDALVTLLKQDDANVN